MNTDTDLFKIETNHVVPMQGSLLISEPFLQSCVFGRSVILLVDHTEGGSMGLVLNKPLSVQLGDVLQGFDSVCDIPMYRGGPVGTDTLFFLHNLEDVPGAMPVGNGLWLNGDFDAVQAYIKEGGDVEGRIRFFVGYAGWESGQLKQEIASNTWMIGHATASEIMQIGAMNGLWKRALGRLGGKYAIWARFPQNPMLN